MVSGAGAKVVMAKANFRKVFESQSLLSKENAVDVLSPIVKPSAELEQARKKWNELQPIFDDALDGGDGGKNAVLSNALQSLRMEMDGVNSALTCVDVVGVQAHILGCILCYQKLHWLMYEPDFSMMDQMTDSIRNIVQI
jgi:hypothetical protein